MNAIASPSIRAAAAHDGNPVAPLDIICTIFDPNRGGPVIRARSVYERMREQGHQAEIVFPDAEGTAAAYVAEAGLPYTKLKISKPVLPNKPLAFLKYAITLPLAIMRVRSYFRRRRPSVVHVNGAFDFVPALAARLAGVPLVWHLNDTVFPSLPSRMLGRLVLALASEIPVAATRVGEHYGIPASRSTLLPAPVNVERFAARDPGHVPGNSPSIGMVGNWNWIKQQDHFVDVISILRARGLDAHGTIVGGFIPGQEGFFEPILTRIQRDGLSEAITADGFCEDVPSEVASFDISLLTSHSEACPMCVLEAMSVGVPVVAYDVGGAAELLGEGNEAAGIVVPPGDKEAMAKAVQTLLADSELYQRMARNGQSRARQIFALEACVARHIEIYRKAIGSA